MTYNWNSAKWVLDAKAATDYEPLTLTREHGPVGRLLLVHEDWFEIDGERETRGLRAWIELYDYDRDYTDSIKEVVEGDRLIVAGGIEVATVPEYPSYETTLNAHIYNTGATPGEPLLKMHLKCAAVNREITVTFGDRVFYSVPGLAA